MRILSAVVSSCVISSASAEVVLSRAALNADDLITWNQFGQDFTSFAGPAAGITQSGLSFMVSDTDASLQRRDFGISYAGPVNLTVGEALVFTAAPNQVLTIEFGTTVYGIGANFLPSTFGQYGAEIKLFDDNDVLLETVGRSGIQTSFSDPDASFLGASRAGGFTRAEFRLVGLQGFLLLNSVSVNPVPAPSVGIMFGIGGFAAVRRRR